jgi:hypothetical protein
MADVDIVPEGQEALGTPDTGIGSTAPEQEPFLKIDDTTAFNTPDEAIKAFKEGTARHSEHKQAMSALEEDRRRYENDKALWLRQQADFDEKIKFYKDVDNFFKSNPKAFSEVQKMVRQGASGADIQEIVKQAIDEQVGPKLNEVEEYRKREMAKAERSRYYEDLKKRYPDFDEQGVTKVYDELMTSPEANLGTLLEYIHFALKGRGTDPAKIQRDTLDNLEKKSKAGIPSGKGASHSAEKKANNLSIRQLAEKHKRELGG